MNTVLTVEVEKHLTDEQIAVVNKSLDALKVFLVSPNETATDANNALQKLAGEARKAVMGDAIKKAPKKVGK